MNIASLSLCYPSPAMPGAGTFVQKRLAAVANHASVRVFHAIPTPVWSARAEPVICNDIVPPVTHIPMPYIPGLSLPINPQLYTRAVLPIIQEHHVDQPFDLIDAHFCFPDAVAAQTIAKILNIPYTVTLRGLFAKYTRNPLTRRSVINAPKNASAIITVSDDLKTQAAAHGIATDRIHVVPNGIDATIFKTGDKQSARTKLKRDPDEKILLTVGHLCPRKGTHRVIQSLPDLLRSHPNLHYVIVGDDAAERSFRQQLIRLVAKNNLQSHVTFTGHLPPSDIARWMQAADLFVLPTKNEGWCNVLHEAVACRIPIVTTNVGGNREIVAKDAGTIIPPDNPLALTTAIAIHLDNPVEPPISALASRTWSTVADETLAVFDRVSANSPRLHSVTQ